MMRSSRHGSPAHACQRGQGRGSSLLVLWQTCGRARTADFMTLAMLILAASESRAVELQADVCFLQTTSPSTQGLEASDSATIPITTDASAKPTLPYTGDDELASNATHVGDPRPSKPWSTSMASPKTALQKGAFEFRHDARHAAGKAERAPLVRQTSEVSIPQTFDHTSAGSRGDPNDIPDELVAALETRTLQNTGNSGFQASPDDALEESPAAYDELPSENEEDLGSENLHEPSKAIAGASPAGTSESSPESEDDSESEDLQDPSSVVTTASPVGTSESPPESEDDSESADGAVPTVPNALVPSSTGNSGAQSPINCGSCNAVWNVDAAGTTCGARISWLLTQGYSSAQAKAQVCIKEFPQQCGGCCAVGCTASNSDPYTYGVEIPCCAGLSKCFGMFGLTGGASYRCLAECPGYCTPVEKDPYSSGGPLSCCSGFKSCLGTWGETGRPPHYLCKSLCGNEGPLGLPMPDIPWVSKIPFDKIAGVLPKVANIFPGLPLIR